MRLKIAVWTTLTLLNSACVGPLVQHEPARTLGRGKADITGGYGTAGHVLKFSVGVHDRVDLGVYWESLSLGVRAKVGIVNNRDGGWSLGVAGGTGLSIGGSHVFGDLITSYLADRWEPYGAFRWVRVKTDPVDFRDEETGAVDFTVDLPNYSYGQVVVGTRYWVRDRLYFSLEASTLIAMSSGLDIGSNVLIGGAIGSAF